MQLIGCGSTTFTAYSTYAAEGATTEQDFDAHSLETEAVLRDAAQTEGIAFAALKPSALGSSYLMAQKSQDKPLSEEAQQSLKLFEERLEALCKLAYTLKVPLLIDAETYNSQAYIDKLVMKMSAQYNQEWVCLYNTYQLYLKDAYSRLEEAQAEAQRAGFLLGAKLVRGAYMEKERQLAAQNSYPSPIHDNKAESDADYNRALCYVLDNLQSCALFAGTHNAESCALLCEEVAKRGLQQHSRICASQLYGMSEALSYGLQRAGVRVAKYIPYGPYEVLLPYLYRRALENSALQGQSSREQLALARELRRRNKKPRSHYASM